MVQPRPLQSVHPSQPGVSRARHCVQSGPPGCRCGDRPRAGRQSASGAGPCRPPRPGPRRAGSRPADGVPAAAQVLGHLSLGYRGGGLGVLDVQRVHGLAAYLGRVVATSWLIQPARYSYARASWSTTTATGRGSPSRGAARHTWSAQLLTKLTSRSLAPRYRPHRPPGPAHRPPRQPPYKPAYAAGQAQKEKLARHL